MLLKMFHYLTANFCYFVLLFIYFQITVANLPDELIPELYLKYKEAVSDDNSYSTRRLFKNDKLYEIHVKRLKDVNGFKVHNLMIREEEKTKSNALIYINNPVESRIPKAYLTIEEFKNALLMRAQAHKDILGTETNVLNTNAVSMKSVPIKKLPNVFYTKKLITVRDHDESVRSTKGTNEDVLENRIIESTKYLFTETDTPLSKTEIKENIANELDGSTSVKTPVLRTITNSFETSEQLNAFDLETTTFSTVSSKTNILLNNSFNKLTNMSPSLSDITTSLDQASRKENLPKVKEVIKETTQKILKVSRVSKALRNEIKRNLDNSTTITKPDLRTSTITQSFEPSEQLNARDIKITTAFTVSSFTNSLFNNTKAKFINMSTILNDPETKLVQELVKENLPKVTEVTKKKTPKRLKVSRVSKATEKLTTTTTKRKRSTLGRPLVFMGGPETY